MLIFNGLKDRQFGQNFGMGRIRRRKKNHSTPKELREFLDSIESSVGLFESFGTLLGFVQNRKSMQTLSFVLFQFWFQNKD